MSENQDAVIGKTVARVEYAYDDALRLHFADGTMLYVNGVWHNDETAGTEVALINADEPKSWHESKDFYVLVHGRAWDMG